MKKIEEQNFDLVKVKLSNKNHLSVEWYDLNNTNDLLAIDSDSLPSEDLIVAFKSLKKFFAESLGLNSGWEFAREHNKSNEELLKAAIRGVVDERERCEVFEVSYVSTNEREGIQIKGTLNCEGGAVSGLKTPPIRFVDEDREEETTEELLNICETLKNEVFSFIYKGKRANDLFTNEKPKEGVSGLNNLKKVV